MSDALDLIPGKKYTVIKSFTDYDRLVHEIGETWIFVKTNFVPYHDGLTLHVKSYEAADEEVYRFQWIQEEQANIIDNFKDFVELTNE
ncbi:MAG TPA: DUF3601 domain-containing protein [Saprospiraceae bacterium]|nr:DUF3601 domain-containing protein [Saprospiraceae bacterium]